MKKNIKGTIYVVGFGLLLIFMGLFTDYTLSISRLAIPQWATTVIGVVLIVGWIILNLLPDKHDGADKPVAPRQ